MCVAFISKDDVHTREELISYLATSSDGVPFLQELWDRCVEKANEDSDKERPVKIVKDKNGNTTTRANGVVIKDPVKWYFRLMNLPYYKKKAIALAQQQDIESETRKEFMEVYFDDNESQEYDDIAAWINMFPNQQERQYLKQRLAHYYDNYDINDGADRTMLSGILSIEVELFRINMRRAEGKNVDINQEVKLRKMLIDNMEAQKWTKKQRSASEEMAQNRFTVFMEKQMKNGEFKPEHHELPKDEIDFFLELLPQQMKKMFD